MFSMSYNIKVMSRIANLFTCNVSSICGAVDHHRYSWEWQFHRLSWHWVSCGPSV